MAAPILCYYNHAPDATISASGALSALPASRMQDAQRTRVCRISGATTQIDLTFSSSVTARALALTGLGDSSFTGLSTFTVKASTSALGSTDQLSWTVATDDGGVDTVLMQAGAFFDANVTARYWRINLTATGVTNLEIGQVYLGQALALDDPPEYPLTRGFDSRHLVRRTYAGSFLTYERPSKRRVAIRFGSATGEAEMVDDLERIFQRRGGHQVLWVQDPGDASNGYKSMIVGNLTSVGDTDLPGWNQRAKTFEISEA